jgi:tRNA nucleotidyltransferase/poly(A) polymerase/tetratricopeptide (TPR) repeat protein
LIESNKKNTNESKISFRLSEDFYQILTADFPLYPDAYIELAELYAKNKDPENAIAYYEFYLKVVPFDLCNSAKLAQQRDILNKLHPDNPPYPNNDFIAALNAATAEKSKENHFRKWYHIRLRKQLSPTGLPITAPIMNIELRDDIDYTDPSLSNGAVIYAYLGNRATMLNLPLLANYYNHKAILKFKDDFISITHCAYSYHAEGDSPKAIAELTKCIEKYRDCFSFIKRHLIHLDLGENEKAKADLISFLNIGEKTEFDIVGPPYRCNMIAILNDETYVSYPHIITQLTSKQVDDMKKIVSASIKAIDGKRYEGNYIHEIQTITKLLKDEPYNGNYYAWRGFFYLHLGDYENAKLNYSLALMFSAEIYSSDFYFTRISINLITGDLERVRYDYNNITYLYQDPNDRIHIFKLCEKFAKECLARSKMHLEKGNFALAEAICELGLMKYKCTDLYLQYAISCGLQEKYDKALKVLSELKSLAHASKSLTKNINSLIVRYMKLFSEPSRTVVSNIDASPSGIKSQEKDSTAEKTKIKPSKPRLTLLNRHQPKRSTASTTCIKTLLEDAAQDKDGLDEMILEDEKIAQELRKTQELEKKMKEKMRIKAKKSKLHDRRKSAHADENNECKSASETENQETSFDDNYVTKIPLSIKSFPDNESISLELQACEKAVFNLFASCKLQHPQQKFKTYIVGGWVYDRVREYKFRIAPPPKQSDFDMVTEFPMETLQAQLPTFKVVPQVRGLLQGKVGGYQVDIIHRQSLSPLIKDANSRDFFCVYMDEDGRIHDPTGFALMYMKDNLLKSVGPVGEVFKKDPLIILRAVYASTKRNLRMTDLKKQIKIDKGLLIPRIGSQENDTLYHPHRFNVLIKKAFSQQLALKNYDLMDKKLGLLEILFPHIYVYLQKDNEWMRTQMQTTDCIEWPKLEIIYANMIACAVMQQVNEKLDECVDARLKETNLIFSGALALNTQVIAAIKIHTESKLIEYYTRDIIKQSLLFSQLEKLPSFINKSIDQWKYFQTQKNPSAVIKKTEPALETPSENIPIFQVRCSP